MFVRSKFTDLKTKSWGPPLSAAKRPPAAAKDKKAQFVTASGMKPQASVSAAIPLQVKIVLKWEKKFPGQIMCVMITVVT